MTLLRAYDRILDGLAFIAVGLLLAIMVGIGADVTVRYIFDRPIGWMLEFVQHSLICILFLGMPWLTRERGHVSIDMIVDSLPVSSRRLLITFGLTVAGLTSGFVGYWAIWLTIDNFQRGVETNGIYPIPRAWLIAVMALGLVLSALEFLRYAWNVFHATDDAIINRHAEPSVEP